MLLSLRFILRCFFVSLILLSGALSFADDDADVRMGAEVELQERHLVAFAQYLDMDELQSRMLKHLNYWWPQFVKEEYGNDKIMIEKFSSQHAFSLCTVDLPLVVSEFFDVVDPSVRAQLLSGLEGEYQKLKSPIVPSQQIQAGATAAQTLGSSQGLILPQHAQPDRESRIILNSQGLQQPKSEPAPFVEKEIILGTSPEHISKANLQSFWAQVNKRWNELPLLTRLGALDWKYWPISAKAKFMVALHTHLTPKVQAQPHDPKFRRDYFYLKFLDPRVQAIYDEHYVRPDRPKVVEFHTLKPLPYEEFMLHLKRLLSFVNQEKAILFPGTNFRRDSSLHVHISSSRWVKAPQRSFEYLISTLKLYIALQGLAHGDVDTFQVIQMNGKPTTMNTLTENVYNKDVARIVQGEPRIEIRLFFDNVEEEIRFYNELAQLDIEEAQKLLNKKLYEILTVERVYRIASMNPLNAHTIIGFERLKAIGITPVQFEKFIEIQIKNAQKVVKTKSSLIDSFSFNKEIQKSNDPKSWLAMQLRYLKELQRQGVIVNVTEAELPLNLIKVHREFLTSGSSPVLTTTEYNVIVDALTSKNDQATIENAISCKKVLTNFPGR